MIFVLDMSQNLRPKCCPEEMRNTLECLYKRQIYSWQSDVKSAVQKPVSRDETLVLGVSDYCHIHWIMQVISVFTSEWNGWNCADDIHFREGNFWYVALTGLNEMVTMISEFIKNIYNRKFQL